MDIGILANSGWIQSYVSGDASSHYPIVLNPSGGNVGIGTTNPTYPLDVSGTAGANLHDRYFGSSGDSGSENWVYGIKIRTDGGISCDIIAVSSDSRIKKDITEIPDGEALSKIRLLNPSKYKYIDNIVKGSNDVYGFLAQEVKTVLPYAVDVVTDYIPNVYQGGTFNNNTITLSQPHGLTTSGNIKLLITTETRPIFVPYIVVDTLRISIDTTNLPENEPSNDPIYDKDGNQLDYNIFVYGVEVNDFHKLKKDAIWSTGVAALQEVDRIQQDLVTQLNAEKAKVVTLETQVSTLETELAAIKTHLGL
jgi:hypothetical protein